MSQRITRALRFLLVSAALALATGPLLAYTVYLKDGTRIVAREAYRVEGNQAIITLPNGTRTSIAVSEIDAERTEKANLVDYGDAVVVDEKGGVRPLSEAAADESESQPNLIEIARRNRALRTTPSEEDEEEDTAETAGSGRLPLTPAGNVDLLRANRVTLSAVEIGTVISQVLRTQGVEGVSIYQGTRPGRILLEFTTNSEAAVFRALEASARALIELEQQRPGAVEAFELFMATDQRQRAGQFLLTPAKARELLTRQIDLPAFFLKYVQF